MSDPGNGDDTVPPVSGSGGSSGAGGAAQDPPGPDFARPSSAGPDLRGPEFVRPDQQVFGQGGWAEPPTDDLAPRAQESVRGASVTALVLGILLTLVIAAALVAGRPLERLLSPSAPYTPSSTTAPDDPIAQQLAQTEMSCAQAYQRTRITVCMGRPGAPHSDIRWLSTPAMTEYRFYHRADSNDDHELLVRRLEAFTVGGLSIDDVSKIEEGMERSRRQHQHITVRADWGVMDIEYIDTLTAFQIKGRMDGETERTVTAIPFGGGKGEVSDRLESDGYDCRDNDQELTCETSAVSLRLYRTTRGADTFDYVSAYPRSGQSGAVTADDAVVAIVDLLSSQDAERIRDVISTYAGADFYLGTVGGVLIRIEPAAITLEPLSW